MKLTTELVSVPDRTLSAVWRIDDESVYREDLKQQRKYCSFKKLYQGKTNTVKACNKKLLHNFVASQFNKDVVNYRRRAAFSRQLYNMMAEEIRKEIDNEIIRDLFEMAKASEFNE